MDTPPACQLRIMRDIAAVASFIFSSTIVASPVRSDSIAALGEGVVCSAVHTGMQIIAGAVSGGIRRMIL